MKDKKIKKIPYGVANYELLVQQNSYYVDKTTFYQWWRRPGIIYFLSAPGALVNHCFYP